MVKYTSKEKKLNLN